MKKYFGILLILVAAFMLTACGKKDLSKYAGTYEEESENLVGAPEEKTKDDFTIKLEEDGTGSSTRGGATYKLTWEVNGEEFKFTETFAGMTIDYNGTIKDNKIEVYNGDKTNDFTMHYVFVKK